MDYYDLGKVLWSVRLGVLICEVLNIPTPKSWKSRANPSMFSLVPPQWSLEFEYIANLIYILILRYCSTLIILILTIFSGIFFISLVIYRNEGDIHYGFTLLQPFNALYGIMRLLFNILMEQLIARILERREKEEEEKEEKEAEKEGKEKVKGMKKKEIEKKKEKKNKKNK